jgi:nitroreductase
LKKQKEMITTLTLSELENMHLESREWLSEIDFWCDETAFLAKYVANLNQYSIPVAARQTAIGINTEILSLSGSELDNLKQEVRVHESELDDLMEMNDFMGTVDYRKKHIDIRQKISRFTERFRKLKKQCRELSGLHRETDALHNETLQTIYTRRAIRKYKDVAVEGKLVDEIIRAGKMAPSAMNQQPWKFYVLSNPERIQAFSNEIFKLASGFFDLHKLDHQQSDDPIFHKAPVVIFLTVPRNNEWAFIDAGMCAQNMTLAAKSLGLDSCPVGLASFIEKTRVYPLLGIPSAEKIAITLVFGYGDEQGEMHERKKDNVLYLV